MSFGAGGLSDAGYDYQWRDGCYADGGWGVGRGDFGGEDCCCVDAWGAAAGGGAGHRRYGEDRGAGGRGAAHSRRIEREAGDTGVGAGGAERGAAGAFAGGHLGRNDDGGGLRAGAERGGSGGGDSRIHGRVAGERVHGLFDALHLFEFEHAGRDFAVRGIGAGGVSEHQDIHDGHEAAGGADSNQSGG